MTTNEALRKIAIGLSRESVKVQAENLTELCETARGIAVEAIKLHNSRQTMLGDCIIDEYFQIIDSESEPVLLAACREALALLQDPDAEAFDADAVTAILERAISNAERGEG